MKPIDGVNLGSLVAEAASDLLEEKKSGIISLIKSKTNELNQAVERRNKAQNQLDSENKKIERLTGWLEQVKSGNWEVLNLSEKSEE